MKQVPLYSDRLFDFNRRFVFCGLASAVVLTIVPLAGLIAAGMDPSRFLDFPPRPPAPVHPAKNHLAFAVAAAAAAALTGPVLWRFARAFLHCRIMPPRDGFPAYGYAGALLLAASWAVSWKLLPVADAVRMWSFSPLWLGFILVLNAFSRQRTGTCLMERGPWKFLALFLVSTVFWWYFEFMNRFVGNWYYVGVEGIGTWRYVLMASLAFSTVLPAVMSMNEALKCTCAFERAFNGSGAAWMARRDAAVALTGLSAVSLALVAMAPDFLFPLLWMSPLLIVAGMERIFHIYGLLDAAAEGAFGALVRLCASGLVCGFFWEMWNFWSYPKWQYSIPFVDHFRIFEMPLLGYLGYLPFGLECAAVSFLVLGGHEVLDNPLCSPPRTRPCAWKQIT